MLEVEHLRKQYGTFTAVDDVSFTAQPGQIFGLLGPNGAGKSTTIGCISGLLKPTSGHIRILGHDVVTAGTASRQQLGVVPQDLALYEDLPARENLMYWGAAYGLRGQALKSRVDEVLNGIGLLDRASDAAGTFSGGMKRRLNFGCAIVHRPKVLLLDEPTVGVDPQSRERLLDLVREQAEAGTCVVYTTHYMEEVERLCEQLVIVDHGRVIAAGTLAELRGMMGERDVLHLTGAFDADAVRTAFKPLETVQVLHAEPEQLQLSVQDAPLHLATIFDTLNNIEATIRSTTLSQPNLESLFIKLTGKALRK